MPDELRERRLVTVLFSDLSGFTRLSESMDPEDVTDLVDALFRRLRPLIENRGGTVDKFIGDAVMAVFGAPVAHADDASRAVGAALAMQRELAEFNRERQQTLRMRIGLNTGEVLWGGIGGDRATATGDAVNVAQRMESSATPGGVLASATTERFARSHFSFRSQGTVEVKGRKDPVVAFEVLGEAEVAAPPGETPLAGRGEELRRLHESVKQGGAFIVLTGEAGVGKTRLAAELRRLVKAEFPGMWIATGRAELGSARPMAAFEDIALAEAGTLAEVAACVARQCEASITDPVERENDGLLVARSLGLVVPGSRIEAIDPARLEPEQRLAWTRWIGARLPALLCVEDLHEAGAPTRALLGALARAHAGRGLSIVATSRPGAPPPDGFESRLVTELPPAAVTRLAESILGGPLRDDFTASLLQQTGGNPCYVEQLCRFLAEEKLLTGPPFGTASAAGIPAGLSGVLVARLDALPPDYKAALKGASAVGLVFWQGLVSQVLDRDVAEALGEARRREMVARLDRSQVGGDTEFAFRHSLLRDAAYSLLTRRERQRLHDRAASVLEARIPDGGRPLRALAALQRDAAGDGPAAAAHWLQVAQEALAEHQLEEARAAAAEAVRLGSGPAAQLVVARACFLLARFGEAIAASEAAASSTNPAHRAAGLHLLAESRGGKGEFEAAVDAANRALAEDPGPEIACEVRLTLAHLRHGQGRPADALAEVDRADAILDASGDAAPGALRLRAEALVRRAVSHRMRGEYDAALALLQRSVDACRSSGNTTGLQASLSEVGIIRRRMGRYEEALAAFREVQEFERRSGARLAAARTLGNLGNLYFWMRRMDEAVAALEESLRVHREAGAREGVASGLINLGVIHQEMGRREEAIAEQREALAISRELGLRENVFLALGNLSISLGSTGKTSEALEASDEAIALAEADGNRPAVSSLVDQHGKLLRTLGRIPEALAAHTRSVALKREMNNRPGLARALRNLGDSRRAAGDSAGAVREAATLFAAHGEPEFACEQFEAAASDYTRANEPAAARESLEEGLSAARAGGLAPRVEQFTRALERRD